MDLKQIQKAYRDYQTAKKICRTTKKKLSCVEREASRNVSWLEEAKACFNFVWMDEKMVDIISCPKFHEYNCDDFGMCEQCQYLDKRIKYEEAADKCRRAEQTRVAAKSAMFKSLKNSFCKLK